MAVVPKRGHRLFAEAGAYLNAIVSIGQYSMVYKGVGTYRNFTSALDLK